MYTYKDHNGREAVMSAEEVVAIERTGRTSPLPVYVTPLPLPDHGKLMRKRPGAIDAGLRPVHYEDTPRQNCGIRPILRPVVWHLRVPNSTRMYPTACGVIAYKADIFRADRFASVIDHEKICPECRALYNAS